MSAKTSSSSTDVASSRRHAFRDYVVAYKLQPGVLMFEDILGETTDVNINFQVPSRRNCVVTFFKGVTVYKVELLSKSESDDSELSEFTWKPLLKMTDDCVKRLLVLRKRL
ncbi:unnamed protein product [Mesocestoides corti]|uniref:Uncharacterized protein n=1 Tax=Mesocestoides corti TaxID=53468 RepID=A0A0R3U902_MESCO|nr:unnamed protein product [Mesocestoides corti]